jgi:predicted transcriptional regulator
MNTAKTNYLIEISEAEMVATIELIAPLFMLLILVSVMTTNSPQKIRPACGESVLNIILKKPITFMKLVSESGCAAETVEKYVKTHVTTNQICQKKGKFRILYSPLLKFTELEFYELMLNPTVKAIVLVLLKSKPLSQIELVSITDKSNPSVSRGLKLLMDKKIIRRNYHAPYSTYYIVNKSKIISTLTETNPTIANNFDQFDLCYPKPSIFLSIFE